MNHKDYNGLLQSAFERLSFEHPDKTAIVFKEQEISYSQLNIKANYIASLLHQQGLKSEDLVLVMLDKSIVAIASLFGILKAGGAYVPVDPETPLKRLEMIIKESSPRAIITERKFEHYFKTELVDCEILFIEDIVFPDHHEGNLSVEISNFQLSYVIFTSGSTGKPKGVMLEHKGVVNTIEQLVNRYYIDKKSRLLQFSSFAFDSSVAEVFSILSVGGCLILAPDSDLKNLTKLKTIMAEEKVTHITLPPSLLSYIDFRKFKNLKTLISAGEECPVNLANKLYKQVPHFINAYGPTECSICVTTYEVKSDLSSSVPIGSPIRGAQIFLLDQERKKISAGKEGEIFVSGLGVARGYLNDTEKTKSRFVLSPFDTKDVLYKTNDKAVQLPDGNYVFRGRTDFQVKIRGNRVELEDIERCIHDFKHIDHVAVILEYNSNNKPILVCFYTSKEEHLSTKLRNYIKTQLPSYMVPHRFMQIKTIPLNINGKVDRTKLKAIIHSRFSQREMQNTQKPIDEEIINIWKKSLGLEKISISDNFFDLDGDSLLAMLLISEINSKFDVNLDVSCVFEYSDLSNFISYVKRVISRQ